MRNHFLILLQANNLAINLTHSHCGVTS